MCSFYLTVEVPEREHEIQAATEVFNEGAERNSIEVIEIDLNGSEHDEIQQVDNLRPINIDSRVPLNFENGSQGKF